MKEFSLYHLISKIPCFLLMIYFILKLKSKNPMYINDITTAQQQLKSELMNY